MQCAVRYCVCVRYCALCGSVRAYGAMRCAVLRLRSVLLTYAFAVRCPGLAYRPVLCAMHVRGYGPAEASTTGACTELGACYYQQRQRTNSPVNLMVPETLHPPTVYRGTRPEAAGGLNTSQVCTTALRMHVRVVPDEYLVVLDECLGRSSTGAKY
eukprot:3363645-Rhodomonas_salina.1